jgi:serine/threonine-protein kinase
VSTPAFEPRRFGAYALEARLGHGGMAEVFLATREGAAGFMRQCVIKRILGHHNEDPSFVDMFINEAKIAAKLTHPNITQVYELGQVDDEFFIAMEYVKGRDLLRVLRELAQTRPADPTVPPSLAAYIARDTCRGLQHAHEHSDEHGTSLPIIHRDISPQNIMITYDGMVKLVDFGIAKALGSMREETRAGALKGKFAYMAPEQVGGQSPGPSSDVFSTGVVLHEMLTGRRLFKGASDFETLDKVRNMVVPVPSSINPRVSPEIDAVVMRALERDRGARYERASQMARELDLVLQTLRFSVEEMSEFMRSIFPTDKLEPPGNENITKEYMVKSGSGKPKSGRDVTPVSNSGVPRGYAADARPELTPSGGTGGRRAIFMAGGLALLVGTSAIFLVGRKGTNDARHEDTTKAAQTGPEVIQLRQEMRLVRVRSEPAGARVFEGPRLVGEAPVELRLAVDSPGMTLTLVHEGRADLTYLVRPADAPEITLRLSPSAGFPGDTPPPSLAPQHGTHTPTHGTHGASPKPTHSTPGGQPKVEIFDDSAPTSRPKVDAIDE